MSGGPWRSCGCARHEGRGQGSRPESRRAGSGDKSRAVAMQEAGPGREGLAHKWELGLLTQSSVLPEDPLWPWLAVRPGCGVSGSCQSSLLYPPPQSSREGGGGTLSWLCHATPSSCPPSGAWASRTGCLGLGPPRSHLLASQAPAQYLSRRFRKTRGMWFWMDIY